MAQSNKSTDEGQQPQSYSFISVAAAPEEEVFHVDASGVHRVSSSGADVDTDQQANDNAASDIIEQTVGRAANGHAEDAMDADITPTSSATKSESAEDQTLEDLDQPVPFANMQRIIIVLLLVLLVGFIIYFLI